MISRDFSKDSAFLASWSTLVDTMRNLNTKVAGDRALDQAQLVLHVP